MVETDLERDVMLADFGVSTVINGVSIIGIYDNEYVETDLDGNVGVSSSTPVLQIKSTDAASVVVGHIVVIGVETYIVRVIMPDGTGMTTLVLERQ